jgi:uncharacterized membrane protein
MDASAAFFLGVLVAVGSNSIVGASFVMLKKATAIAKQNRSNVMKIPLWWVGQVCMALGEIGNFLAYGIAPPTVVVCLGSISVVVSQIGSFIVLRERITWQNVCGTLLVLLGSTAIVIVAPAVGDAEKYALADVPSIGASLIALRFLLFSVTLVASYCWLRAALIPMPNPLAEPPEVNLPILIGQCTVLSAFLVQLAKCASTILLQTFVEHNSQFGYPLTYGILGVFIFILVLQARTLNLMIETFDNSRVVPPYFVCFTISAIIASALLFGDLSAYSFVALVLSSLGLVFVFGGIFLLKWKPGTENEIKLNSSEE